MMERNAKELAFHIESLRGKYDTKFVIFDQLIEKYLNLDPDNLIKLVRQFNINNFSNFPSINFIMLDPTNK